MHEFECLRRREVDLGLLLVDAEKGQCVDQEGHPKVFWRQTGPKNNFLFLYSQNETNSQLLVFSRLIDIALIL